MSERKERLQEAKVAAVVVAYNRKELLRECLQALLNQTQPPDEIILIDNASTDGTDQMVSREFPQVTYVRLPENIGGAGGFHEGMKLAYEKGHDWIWVMDDDGKPAEDCLEGLLSYAEQADVLVPVQIDSLGRRYGAGCWRNRYVPAQLPEDKGAIKGELFSFVGPLVHRRVCQTVGFPRKDFFSQADDLEYALRIRRAKFNVIFVTNAIVYHEYDGTPVVVRRFGRVSIRGPRPAWKIYYSARNTLLMFSNLDIKERLLSLVWFFALQIRYTLGELIYGSNRRSRTWYRWLGVFHGLMGYTGKRVDPPSAAAEQKRS